jgi:hypothetical protein
MKTPPAYRLFAASGITKPAHPARVALVTYLFCDLHRNARRLPTSFGGIAGANEGTKHRLGLADDRDGKDVVDPVREDVLRAASPAAAE